MTPDLAVARRFLARLDPEADCFTFQTFDDTGAERTELVRIVHAEPGNGRFEALATANARGAGIFVTINATDGKGRRAGNVERVRALFLDLDGAPLDAVLAPGLIEPHIVCETSPGRWQALYLVSDCPLDRFGPMQRAIARRFGGDPSVYDLPRVARVPGFLHQKREPFLSRLVDDIGHDGPPYTLANIVASLELDAAEDAPPRERYVDGGRVVTGGRNAHLFAAGRSMAQRLCRDAVLAALTAENAQRCDPPLPADRITYIAERSFSAKDSPEWLAAQADDAPPLDVLKPAQAPPLRLGDVPDVLARFAASQSRATGIDAGLYVAGGIGAACGALSDDVRLLVSSQAGHFESGRLWVVSVGGPGSGKSPAAKAALAPVFAMHREACAAWARKRTNEEAANPEPVPQLFTSDATVEALSDVLRGQSRGLLLFTDEVESWLASHDCYRGNGGGRDRGEWLRLFDGGPHQVNRVRRGAFHVPNWGCSLLSATTPAALRKLAPKLPDDGLLQRLLFVVARPMVDADATMLRVEAERPREDWDAALRRLNAYGSGVVRLSADALDVFTAEQRALRSLALAYEDAHPSFAAHVAKRAAMLARLALLFHALESEEAFAAVPAQTMQRAVAFLRRQEWHAAAVYGGLLGGGTALTLAKDVARTILAAGLARFKRSDLMHQCRRFRDAAEPEQRAALAFLGDAGWVRPDGSAFAHGAAWTVDERVHALFAAHGEAARAQRGAIRARFAAGIDEAEES